MKILVASNSAWNLYNFRLPMLKMIAEQGHSLILLSPKDEFIEKLMKELECTHLHLNSLNPRSIHPIADLNLFFELQKAYKKIKPDLIFHFTIKLNIYGGFAAKFNNIKYISNITGLGSSFTNHSILRWWTMKMYRWALNKSICTVFHNQEDLTLFTKASICEKTFLIPGSGIDVQYYKAQKRNSLSVKKFLFAGRILPEKGIFEFCKAAEKIKQLYPDVVFDVVGDLSILKQNQSLELQFNDFVIRNIIQFHGAQSSIKHFYQNADVFVLPSYREGKSKAILEAMAMELPIITTNVPGCNDISNDLFLVLSKNVEELYQMMCKLIEMPIDELQKIGAKNRQTTIQEFSTDKIVNLYQQLIAKIKDDQL